jgi:hypothetical protein
MLLVFAIGLTTAACSGGGGGAPTAPPYTPPPRVIQTLVGLSFSPDTVKIRQNETLPSGTAYNISGSIIGMTDIGPSLRGNGPVTELCSNFAIAMSGPGTLQDIIRSDGSHLYGLVAFPTTTVGTKTVIQISACGFRASQVYLVV